MTTAGLDPRALLRQMFDAAVAAAQPARCLAAHLPAPPLGRTLVIGAGKASAEMARALEAHWTGPLEGLVVTRYGYEVPCEQIEIVQAAHPVPDAAGLQAAQRIRALVVLPIVRATLRVVDTFEESARGSGGFGHTGLR